MGPGRRPLVVVPAVRADPTAPANAASPAPWVRLSSSTGLDILAAETASWAAPSVPDHPKAQAFILYGDGKGGFRTTVLTTGEGWHEPRLGDFDGDGDLDVLQKPYTWKTPWVDLWLNGGTGWRRKLGGGGTPRP